MSYRLGEAETRVLLRQACDAVGLSSDGARLLRLGSNAVYRLTAPVVVRVGRPDSDSAVADQTVAVARWLESTEYPAVRALHVDQPLVIEGHAVTFWEALSDEYAVIEEVADVFARLHKLTAPSDLRLPELEPFANADKRISGSDWLSREDREYMTDKLSRLRDGYDRLEFNLLPGVIHGDASIGNVLHDLHGKPAVIDLDDFCIGPREWDLIQTALYADRYGWHTREEYTAFVRIYGYDIMRWSGYSVLADVREFIQVTWMIQKARESERAAKEARKRINTIRTGASRRDWSPF